ncbi:hypothetical protein BDW59DRAFT_161860 [Aspergillus cavernicola]|uniref:MARVEL domain-containing protein n=1 Tax=Aspergillus cavernicola TaxID=176166 RepID=A0ABR4IBM7_9EURO
MASSRKLDKSANPVKYYHGNRSRLAFGVWILAIIILGMAAAIVAKTPPSPLRSAASYNVAVGALQFFLFFFSGTGPASDTDAQPAKRATIGLTISTLIWCVAFPIIFVFRSDGDCYEVVDFDKRAILGVGLGITSALENITLACGAFSVSAFLCIMMQWYYTACLHQGSFAPEHIKKAYNNKD